MADYEDDAGYSSGPAPVTMPYVQPTTTEEARGFSRSILNKYLSNDNRGVEDDYVGQLAKSSDEATAALRAARTRLEAQNYDPRRTELAFAAGNLAPTRSGSMGESFGNAFKGVGEELEKQQQFNLNRSQQELGYDLAIPEQEQQVVKARLDLQKLHEQQQGPMAREALSTVGKAIIPGANMVSSPNAKVAMGEGLRPDDPKDGGAAFRSRVTQLDQKDIDIRASAAGGDNYKKAAAEGLTPGTAPFLARVKFFNDQDVATHAATAGTDSNPISPVDKLRLANQYGVPGAAPTPWAGQPTKTQIAAQKAEETAANKQIAAGETGVQQAQDLERQIDRFMALNKQHPTGPSQGIPGIKQITGMEPDAVEMDKISNKLGPLMRQPGMGRMTNLDLQTFLGSTLGRTKQYQVNDNIATGTKVAIHNQLDFQEFQENYKAVHGHLIGAQAAWNNYLKANPIFDPSKPVGSYSINPNRQDYKTYFRSQNGVAPVLPAGATAPPGQATGGAVRGFADGGSTTGVLAAPPYKADLGDLVRSFEQGATGQWGDEANAALTPGNYVQNVTGQRAAMEKFGSAHPVADFALQGAGGAATGYALTKGLQVLGEHADSKAGKVAAAIAALGRLAGNVPKNFVGPIAPSSAVRTAMRLGLAGGTAGAVSGAGSAQDADHIPGSMATQGAVGAVLGPLSGLVAKYGTQGASALVDKMMGRSVAPGAQKVISTLATDGTTPDQLGAKLAAASRGVPSTTLADVAGPRTQALARAAATRPGANVDQVTASLADRNSQANNRVSEIVNKNLKPDDYSTKMEELTNKLYTQSDPLYKAAYAANPSVKSPAVMNILNNTDAGPKAAKLAAKLMKNDGVPIGPVDATGMVRSPSLQYLDYVKRAMDSMVETAEPNGVSSTIGRNLRGVRNQFRDAVDAATADPNGVSPYAAARQQYAGDLEVRDALRMGREDFNKMSPQELANATKTMSFAEKDALRSGVAEHLFRQVGSTPYTTNPAQKIANVPDVAQKLQALFDQPSEYQSFIQSLSQEMHNFNRAKGVLSSAASGRTADANAGFGAGHTGEAMYEATLGAAGHPVWAGARAARWLSDKLMHNDTAGQAAQILNTPGGAKGRAAIQGLKDQAAQIGARLQRGNTAGLTAAGATGSVTAPNPWGEQQGAQ